jgi:hypothetical protein
MQSTLRMPAMVRPEFGRGGGFQSVHFYQV